MGLGRESDDGWSRGAVAAVVAAAGAAAALSCAALLCCSASLQLMLSLPWLASLHLMVYSFHSGAGCCAMRILSHSIYLPRTLFAARPLELVCSHLELGATAIFKVERKPQIFSAALHDDRCSVLLRCDSSQPAVSGLH